MVAGDLFRVSRVADGPAGEMTTVRATVVAVGDGRWWMVAAGVPGRRVFDLFDDAYGAASGYVSSFGRGVVVDRRGACTVFSPAVSS